MEQKVTSLKFKFAHNKKLKETNFVLKYICS